MTARVERRATSSPQYPFPLTVIPAQAGIQ